MTDREAMQQALEALEANLGNWAAKTKAIAALRERLAQPEPPPECKTEEEKTAFAFGWMKAVEAQRLAQPERIQLTVRDFVVTVGDIEDAVGTPMYWAEWPNKEQP